VWEIPGYLKDAAIETGIALYDEARAAAAFVAYGVLEAAAFILQMAAEAADIGAQLAAVAAKGAARAADIAARLADAAARTAHVLAAVAAQEAAVAAHDDALVARLTAAYARQQARKLAKAARAAARAVKKVAKKVAHAAVAVAKAAYKYSGAQVGVSCVTNPHLSSCIKAAVTVALVMATAGEGEVEVAAMNAAEEGGADVAEQVGAKAAESCGLSFTPGTKVLLANGKAVPISSLKPGEKVVATNTKTGKTQARTIAAVLVHHDTNRYDLTVRAHGRTAIIHTTSNHPFWDATTHRWVKAGALRYGTHLRTPAGGTATVLGGHAPRHRAGWMWDLTVPGDGDHDFYVQVADTAVLVHNCPSSRGWSAQNRANQDWGNDVRDAIAAEHPGSDIEQSFETSLGGRRIDVLTPEGLAIESKTGYTSLTPTVAREIAKDKLLLQDQNNEINAVKWIFSGNRFGESGLSGPLADALNEAGISHEVRP